MLQQRHNAFKSQPATGLSHPVKWRLLSHSFLHVCWLCLLFLFFTVPATTLPFSYFFLFTWMQQFSCAYSLQMSSHAHEKLVKLSSTMGLGIIDCTSNKGQINRTNMIITIHLATLRHTQPGKSERSP